MGSNIAKVEAMEIVKTADGSHSLYRPDIQETYHSNHGAYEESMHVYIQEGMVFRQNQIPNAPVRIFELGFGTGLNALLTCREADSRLLDVIYHSIELFPVPEDVLDKLNYPELPELAAYRSAYQKIISAPWDVDSRISSNFLIRKIAADIFKFQTGDEPFDLIYFDAFGLRAQPELWAEPAFDACYKLLKMGGILVTYASNGNGRRAMEKCGFETFKLAGAVGKREMIRAIKRPK